MKKILMTVIVVVAVMGGMFWYQIAHSPTKQPSGADYKNATYTIEQQNVTLVNGYAESEQAPGSASKLITKYFGNEARGDLNNDGKEDVAFIVTQDGGGSGLFYYVVALVSTKDGYQGTDAIFLGDRISPQATMIENGNIVVSYGERSAKASMAAQTSMAGSKVVKVTGMHLETVR